MNTKRAGPRKSSSSKKSTEPKSAASAKQKTYRIASKNGLKTTGSPKQAKSPSLKTQPLRHSNESRYEILFDCNPHMYFTLDRDRTIVSVNQQGAVQLGYRVEELIGKPVAILFPEEQQEAVRAQVTRCFEQIGVTHQWEIAKVLKDGTLMWVEETAVVIHDERAQPLLLVLCQNITERKRTEEELRSVRLFLDSIIEHLPNMVFVKDAKNLRFVRFNQAAQELTGYSESELIGKNDYDFFPKDQADFFTAKDRATLKGGGLVDITEESIQTKHKGERILHTKKIPIPDTTGSPQFLLGISEDITNQKRAEESLRKAHHDLEQRVQDRIAELQQAFQSLNETTAHLHSVLDQSPLAIIELDLTGSIRRWNNAATQLLGWTKEDVIGHELPYLSPDQEAESNRLWSLMVSGEIQRNVELRWQKNDGTPVDLSFWAVDLRDSSGTRVGYICFLIDITERKKLESQFLQAQKMEAVGRLAGGVAHGFNNLLTIINGYSFQLAAELSSEPSLREMATETLNAGERAAELTKQLLAFSRRLVLKTQPLNLNDSIRSIGSMLNRLLGEDIVLTTDLKPDLWSIESDKGQLDQVVMNLAINARDAMPNGGTLTLTTSHHATTQELPAAHRIMPTGSYVRLSIRDSGSGMTAETLAHIFEPFFTTKPVGQGTGLGLATVYGIVKQSSGYIFADSTVGHGTTFHIYFPRWLGSFPQAAFPTVRRATGTETILLVEDQDSVRAFVVRALKIYGYRIHEAANAADALRLAAALQEPVQILVTDVIMPQMTGLVLAERLRKQWPGLRVLFMSGFTDFAQSSFLEAPGTAFIQKPFLPDVLARQLRQVLDESV